jgi:hypothetical protein
MEIQKSISTPPGQGRKEAFKAKKKKRIRFEQKRKDSYSHSICAGYLKKKKAEELGRKKKLLMLRT